jgi:hypothetical protein
MRRGLTPEFLEDECPISISTQGSVLQPEKIFNSKVNTWSQVWWHEPVALATQVFLSSGIQDQHGENPHLKK